MEFLVEFEVEIPVDRPHEEVEQRQRAESAAAAKLAEDGHLVRLWRRPLVGDGTIAYTFRTSTQIETAAPALEWLNKGVFISVGGRQPGAVVYETYLVA
jgi:muconolactone delta-isomerase